MYVSVLTTAAATTKTQLRLRGERGRIDIRLRFFACISIVHRIQETGLLLYTALYCYNAGM
jgi:hypothetical protein